MILTMTLIKNAYEADVDYVVDFYFLFCAYLLMLCKFVITFQVITDFLFAVVRYYFTRINPSKIGL